MTDGVKPQSSQTGCNTSGYVPERKPRIARDRSEKPTSAVATTIGLSERQIYRLRKKQDSAAARAGDGPGGCRLSAKLLSALGYGELLATDVPEFLEVFLKEFLRQLDEHVRADAAPIDARWAKPNAAHAVDQLRIAAKRRQDAQLLYWEAHDPSQERRHVRDR
jgi:hypothetical protein